jgi:hypothetical protein
VKNFSILLILVSFLTALAYPANAQLNERTHHDVDYSLEDKSCFDVNRAYERMNNSGRWSTTTYWLYPDKTKKLASHIIYFDRRRFQQNDSANWANHERTPVRLTIDSNTNQPIFVDCRFEGIQTMRGEPARYYSAKWQKNGATAAIEIWISEVSQMFVENILHYRKRPDWFDVSNVLQTMDFDRSHAIELGIWGISQCRSPLLPSA